MLLTTIISKMKKRLPFLVLLTVFVACNNNPKEANTRLDSSTTATEKSLKEPELSTGQAPVDKSGYFVWEVDADMKTKKKNPMLQSQYFGIDTLIMGLNERYPQVLLEKKALRNDTLYAEIKNANYLTEQMGSLGAEQYIAQAVLNLTSVNGINYVRIEFEEGSHAAPDVWSKDAFDYKELE